MITGGHIVIHSRDADADRALFRDVLGFPSVDAGGGWLIFALPAAEVAFHPTEEEGHHELYLLCDDLAATTAKLAEREVPCSEPIEAPWGVRTTLQLPGGGKLGLYEPRHPLAFSGS